MNILEYALKYAEMGWEVFPIFGIKNSRCTCGKPNCENPGKHPLLPKGLLSATTDKKKLSAWFSNFKNCNIAVATGVKSGIVVMDVDGELPVNINDIPETTTQITGGNGQHYLFNHPGYGCRSYNNAFEKTDSKADGGYIVVEPSQHKSGKRYEWEEYPWESKLSDVPDFWADKIKGSGTKAEKNNSDDEALLVNSFNIKSLLNSIGSDDYDFWYKSGLALYRAGFDFELFDDWSSKSAKYDAGKVLKKWNSFKKDASSGDKFTVASLAYHAESNGWENPLIEHGKNIMQRFYDSFIKKERIEIENAEKKAKASFKNKTPDLMPKDEGNLIRCIADKIINSSVRFQPNFAVGATIAFLSSILGRKHKTSTGLRTNFYVAGLGRSGAGKNDALKFTGKIAYDAGLFDLIGGSDVTSSQAILTSMVENPAKVYLWDELGLMLGGITKGTNQHKKNIMTVFMQLFSAADGIYTGTEYANTKENPRVDIVQPNLSLYGVTTPSTFFDALSSKDTLSGLMPRFLVIEGEGKKRTVPTEYEKDGVLCNILNKLYYKVNCKKGIFTPTEKSGDKVNMSGELPKGFFTYELPEEFRREIEGIEDNMQSKFNTDAADAVFSRLVENTEKLAMIHEICNIYDKLIHFNMPYEKKIMISEESYQWAKNFAMYSANTFYSYTQTYMFDNVFEENLNKVSNFIRKRGKATRSNLMVGIRSINKSNINEYVERLIETEEVKVMKEGKTKKAEIFIWNKF